MSQPQRPPDVSRGRQTQSTETEELPDEEKLLRLYENLRSELRVRIRVANVRTTRGLALVGGVVGSAMVQSSFHLLAFVPIVFGVLFIDTVRSYNEVLSLSRHMVELERDLSEAESSFQYEVHRGGAFGLARSQWGTLGWLSVANGARVVVYGLIYVGAWTVLLAYWSPPPALFSVRIDRTALAAFALVLSGLLLAVGLSHLAYRRRLSNEIESGGSGWSSVSSESSE